MWYLHIRFASKKAAAVKKKDPRADGDAILIGAVSITSGGIIFMAPTLLAQFGQHRYWLAAVSGTSMKSSASSETASASPSPEWTTLPNCHLPPSLLPCPSKCLLGSEIGEVCQRVCLSFDFIMPSPSPSSSSFSSSSCSTTTSSCWWFYCRNTIFTLSLRKKWIFSFSPTLYLGMQMASVWSILGFPLRLRFLIDSSGLYGIDRSYCAVVLT